MEMLGTDSNVLNWIYISHCDTVDGIPPPPPAPSHRAPPRWS